jgi:linoleoyl-CoA desaturase
MLDLYFHRDQGARPPGERARIHRAFIRKLVRYYGREFVIFPLLGGWCFPKILVGNLLSEVMRDVYSAATIYCGHAGAKDFPANTRARSRGEWYAMQVEAARDFEVPRIISILCGGLNRQIEHHLFPRLSPERLREIAPRVRAACESHGVVYRTDSWPRTLKSTLQVLTRLPLPMRI